MLDTFSRHRSLAWLIGAVLAQVLLLAFQIKREHDVRLIRYWATEIVTPGERAGTWALSKVGGIWNGYIALHAARADNEKLRQELGVLRLRNRELESQAAEAQRLSVLLDFREEHRGAPMLAAQVIGASADPSSHTLFVNRGERDRVRRNLPVITPDGIVGKIVEVFPDAAQVLLINDKDSGVGALLADSRAHGVIKGSGDPRPRMEYVLNEEKVYTGEMILTSGEDRIFPKGLLVGTVADVSSGYPFHTIRVDPGAHLDRLEDVLILLARKELTPKEREESADADAAAQGQPAKPRGVVQAYPPSEKGPAPAPETSARPHPVPASATAPARPVTGAKPAMEEGPPPAQPTTPPAPQP
jgi:rod shape-determining protein MreC